MRPQPSHFPDRNYRGRGIIANKRIIADIARTLDHRSLANFNVIADINIAGNSRILGDPGGSGNALLG